jgi:hypothetical protein
MNKPYDSAILFLGIYSKNMLLYLQNNICLRLLVEAIMQYYNEKRLETTQITIDKNWLNK